MLAAAFAVAAGADDLKRPGTLADQPGVVHTVINAWRFSCAISFFG